MSRADHIAKNMKFALLCQIPLIFANFILRRVFILSLGENYLGLNGLFTNILSILSLAELGFGTSIIFSLYKPVAEGDHEKIKSLMRLYRRAYTVVGIVVLAAGTALTPFLGFFVKEMPPEISHIELIYLLNVVNTGVSYFFIYKTSLLFADQKKYVEVTINTVVKLVVALLQAAALLLFRNYFLYLGIMIMGTLVQNVLISVQTNRMYPYLCEKHVEPLEKDDVNIIKRNVGAMVFHKIGGAVVFSTDSIIMAKFVSVASVGLYSNYIMIRTALLNVINLAFNAITSSMGNLNASETLEAKRRAFRNINFFSAWLFGFCSICLMCLYNPFIGLWLGEEYLFSAGTVLIIVLNFYMYCMRMPIGNTKEVMGLFWNDRFKPIAEVAVNLAASLLLVRRFGLAGVLWGTLISTVAVPLWVEPLVVYRHGLKLSPIRYFARYALYLGVTVAAGCICFFLCRLTPDSLFGFALKCTICLTTPNLLYWLVYRRTEEYGYSRDLAVRMFGKVIKKLRKEERL